MKMVFSSICSLILILLILIGCETTPKFQVPKINEIQSVQYKNQSPGGKSPTALLPDNPNDKVVIQKILSWLDKAKVIGYESNLPVKSIQPNFLEIKLKNGMNIGLSPAVNDDVYVSTSENKKTLRIHSPEFGEWFTEGWEKDFVSTP